MKIDEQGRIFHSLWLDVQQPIFSRDGKAMLAKATVNGLPGIYKWTDSKSELISDEDYAEWPAFSPDARTILFSKTKLDPGLHWTSAAESSKEIFKNGQPVYAGNLLWSQNNMLIFRGCAIWLQQADNCGI